jgi:hypothetical protein
MMNFPQKQEGQVEKGHPLERISSKRVIMIGIFIKDFSAFFLSFYDATENLHYLPSHYHHIFSLYCTTYK